MREERPRNYLIFRKPRSRAIKGLNNIYVVVSIARKALIETRIELMSRDITKIAYKIPTVNGEHVEIARRKSKIYSLIDRSVDRDLFSQSLVAAIALVEDYLYQMLRLIIFSYPQKLACADLKAVDLALVLSVDSYPALLERIIDKYLHSLFYASPREYLQKTNNILAIDIDENIYNYYIEIKATRDLIIHADGKTNEIYLVKAGDIARAKRNELIPLNENYFDDAIRWLKRLVNEVYAKLLAKYGDVKLSTQP